MMIPYEQTREDRTTDGDFEVRLESTPTTGFRWTLPHTPAGVTLRSEHFDTQSAPSPGSGGQQVFRFRLDEPEAELRFELKRPWEATSMRTHIVHVRRH